MTFLSLEFGEDNLGLKCVNQEEARQEGRSKEKARFEENAQKSGNLSLSQKGNFNKIEPEPLKNKI